MGPWESVKPWLHYLQSASDCFSFFEIVFLICLNINFIKIDTCILLFCHEKFLIFTLLTRDDRGPGTGGGILSEIFSNEDLRQYLRQPISG